MSIKIVTDSTSYIPNRLIKELDISVVPLIVNFNNMSYPESSISISTFCKEIKEATTFPASSQPSPKDFYSVFERHISNGDTVVGIFLSSKLSGTYFSALTAKNMILEKCPNAVIHIIDSKTTCMQLGFGVIAAAKAALSGKTTDEAIKQAQIAFNNSRFLFVPKTLEYLKRGGRIGQAAALIGSVLQIRPILTVEDGKVAVLSKVRTQKKAIKTILDTFFANIKQKSLKEVIVHHICAESTAEELSQTIQKEINMPVPVHLIGPVIGLHVGPGSIGIVYQFNKGAQ